MTREEIMQLNTDYLNGCESEHKMNELFSYALEQQPCGDAISRQAVLDINFKRIILTTAKPAETIEQKVKALPSVTQQETYINIPFLLHKEFGCPLDECQKAYNVAIDYLRSQGKVKG